MDEALEANPIHPLQHGFRSNRSTETAISSMVNYLEEYVMSNKHCIGIFLDIKSAFDSISPLHIPCALLNNLQAMPIRISQGET